MNRQDHEKIIKESLEEFTGSKRGEQVSKELIDHLLEAIKEMAKYFDRDLEKLVKKHREDFRDRLEEFGRCIAIGFRDAIEERELSLSEEYEKSFGKDPLIGTEVCGWKVGDPCTYTTDEGDRYYEVFCVYCNWHESRLGTDLIKGNIACCDDCNN